MNLRRPLTWLGRAVAGLVVLIGVAYGAAHLLSVRRANAAVHVAPHFTSAADPADSALVIEGARLAKVKGCVDCHRANLGGGEFINEPMIGVVYAANLTRGKGGRGAEMDAQDWELAIRHGVRRDGSQLAVMPSPEYADLSDQDVAAIVAYARSVEPVPSDRYPAPRLGPMGRVLYVAGQLPAYPAAGMDHRTTHVASMVPSVSVEFGRYVTHSCTGCHGAGFSGGRIPGAPPHFAPAANITPDPATGIGSWSEADFIRALREGTRPDGRTLDPTMPVQLTKHMTDTELRAAYLFLRTVPAKAEGNR